MYIVTTSQRRALRALAGTANGVAYAGHLRRQASLQTLRSLHKLGLVMADQAVIQRGTVVTLTNLGATVAKEETSA